MHSLCLLKKSFQTVSTWKGFNKLTWVLNPPSKSLVWKPEGEAKCLLFYTCYISDCRPYNLLKNTPYGTYGVGDMLNTVHTLCRRVPYGEFVLIYINEYLRRVHIYIHI